MLKSNYSGGYGIIGTSLKHTLSPMIYRYLANKHNTEDIYSVIETSEDELGNTIELIKQRCLSGINVTFPFKQSIIDYLDGLDHDAQLIKSVNTVKIADNKMIGYNTDIFGIKATIENKLNFDSKDKVITIIGAGGAARACIKYFADKNVGKICILNRTMSKAIEIINHFKIQYPRFDITCLDTDHINDNEIKIDLIINTTSADKLITMGLLKLLADNKLLSNTAYFDLNYGERALTNDLPLSITNRIDGLYMLAAQAVKSFEIWHGRATDPDEVYEYLTHEQKRYQYA